MRDDSCESFTLNFFIMVLAMEQPQIFYRIYGGKTVLMKHFYEKEQSLQWLNSFCIKKGIRVATFNVHAFHEARNNVTQFQTTIRQLDADILSIVEFSVFGELNWFANMGYIHFASYGTLMLFSRYPITGYTGITSNGRPIMYATISLNSTQISLCLVHFHPENQDVRMLNAKDLMENFDPDIVMGDFNHVCSSEVDNEFIERFKTRTKTKYNEKLLKLLKAWRTDSFNGMKFPYSTHWSGTRIDYILYNRSTIVPHGSYVWHTTVSDHLPVLMDFTPKSSFKTL